MHDFSGWFFLQVKWTNRQDSKKYIAALFLDFNFLAKINGQIDRTDKYTYEIGEEIDIGWVANPMGA